MRRFKTFPAKMNIIRDKDAIKNSIEEEYNIPHNLDLLNKWTIAKVDYKLFIN